MDAIFDIAIYILEFILIVCVVHIIISAIVRIVKGKSRKEILSENASLKNERDSLQEKINFLTDKIAILEKANATEKKTVAGDEPHPQLLQIGTMKVQSDRISYIVSQSYEQVTNGSSRIKIIHYKDNAPTDSIYMTFETLCQLLPSNFMMINKNQMVNLQEIFKIQGSELYLNGIKEPFLISESKKDDLHGRLTLIH